MFADGTSSAPANLVPDLSLLLNLKEKNLALQGLMVLEGRIVIEKALHAGIVPRFLVCTEAEEQFWRKSSKFPVYGMQHEELCSLVGFKFHHGAFAIADMPRLGAPGLMHTPDSTRHSGLHRFFLCLWDVTDPSNLGALVRTAAGLGAEGVLLSPGCANPYYRKTIRASMGNVFSIPMWETEINELTALQEKGVHLIAASLAEKSKPIDAFLDEYAKGLSPCILVLGNEGYGLPDEVLDLCRCQARIPMNNEVDSLNVAVAGGILMYKILRA